MSRTPAPLWTAEPSRFAGWPRRAALAALFAVALAVLLLLRLPFSGEAGGDPTFQAGAVDALRHGGDYHQVVAAAVRGGEAAGRLALPPPTLAVIAAATPDWALSAMLFALAAATFLAWWPALDAALARPGARVGATLLLLAGLGPYLWPPLLFAPEVWAGLLVALSLGRWARGAWVEAAAFGLAAGVMREAAGAYIAVMGLFAIGTGARREAIGWGLCLAALIGVTAAHWAAIRDAAGPLAGPGEEAATRAGLEALTGASPLALLPSGAAVLVLALALFGWAAWRAGVGLRIVCTVAATAALAFIRPEIGPDWGYLVAAPLLAGLAFAPDGLRDLLRAGGGRRRKITVTRVVR